MKSSSSPHVVGGIILLVAALGLCASDQTTGVRNPSLVISSLYGGDLFQFYCASCHGRDGKGNGPAASSLKTQPPDLTLVARRSGGTFPTKRVEALVTGDEPLPTPAHGSKDMPVWGPIFRSLDPSDRRTRIRISNIVAYLESMQAK